MDHILVNPPFCQHWLLLYFSLLQSPPNMNGKFDTIIMLPRGKDMEVIHVPKIYNWFSKPDGPFTSKLRMTFLTQNAVCLFPKTLIPLVSGGLWFSPLGRAGVTISSPWTFQTSGNCHRESSGSNTLWSHQKRPTLPPPTILWGWHLPSWLLPFSAEPGCLPLLVPWALMVRDESGALEWDFCWVLDHLAV